MTTPGTFVPQGSQSRYREGRRNTEVVDLCDRKRILGLPRLPAGVAMAIMAGRIIAFQCHSASARDELQLKRPSTITEIEILHYTG